MRSKYAKLVCIIVCTCIGWLTMVVPSYAQFQSLTSGKYVAVIDGVNIHYVVRGQGPVMLVGHPKSGRIGYELSLSAMESWFTMVYYDSKGTGESDAPAQMEDYELEGLVAEVEALRKHIGIERIWLFAHSDQGVVALAYGVYYPDHVAGIVMTGVSQIESMEKRIAIRQAFEMERKQQSPWFADVLAQWDYMELHHTTVDSQGVDISMAPMKWWCYNEASAQKVIHIVHAINAAGRRKPIAGQYYQVTTAEINRYLSLKNEYHRILAPVFIINGRWDTNNPPAYAEALRDSLPKASLALIVEAGHFPWIENEVAFYDALKEWLQTESFFR